MTGGVSVVVPVFNSGTTLTHLVAELKKGLSGVETCEVVLVDDDSVDDSWKVIRALSDEHREVRGLRLARNVGEQSAVLCGIDAARYDTIVTIDDDLQQPPTSIPNLLDALEDGVDLVYGIADRYRHSATRQLAASVMKPVLEHLFRVPGASSTSAFRAFRTRLRDGFPPSPGPMCSVDGLLATVTTDVVTITVPHHPRRAGRSQYTPAKLIAHTMSVIAGGSASPLLFATVTGLVCLAAALITGTTVVVVGIVGSRPISVGWLLVSGNAALFGVVLLALGILGEFAARILLRAGGQPAYVVRDTTDSDA